MHTDADAPEPARRTDFSDLAGRIAEARTEDLVAAFDSGVFPYADSDSPDDQEAADFFTRFELLDRYEESAGFTLPAPLDSPDVFLFKYGKLMKSTRDEAAETRLMRWRDVLVDHLDYYDAEAVTEDGTPMVEGLDALLVDPAAAEKVLARAQEILAIDLSGLDDYAADLEMDLIGVPGIVLQAALDVGLTSGASAKTLSYVREEIEFRLQWRLDALADEQQVLAEEEGIGGFEGFGPDRS
ncbi:hypothetical protein [Brevibacterium litoralis]|uniref:hypothetical protein n=1 Tax=Brevibacterium litoralis TaxID=3138935 RepID=UPI0032ED6D3B